MDVAGSVGAYGSSDTSADYAPDGRKWVATGNGAYLRIIYDPFPQPKPDTTVPGTPGCCPVWSPDGAQIAWLREGDIWVMNADGLELSIRSPRTLGARRAASLAGRAAPLATLRLAGATPRTRVSLVPAFAGVHVAKPHSTDPRSGISLLQSAPARLAQPPGE